ncbi:hypothetical protein MKX03_032036 [Papaver bracteatum]|nr:hypothetical protein MKX03_032036 [Papaver bracteatum]
MNSIETDYLQGSSAPFSLIRIRRRLYKTKTAGATSSDAHDFGVSNVKTRFKRLRKDDQLLSFTFNGRRPKNPLVNKASQFVIVPNVMSGKIFQPTRRSKCLVNKGYSFKEAISCCPVGSSDEVLGTNTESSNDISSGCPSPFNDLGDAEVPSGRESVRGNNFSNTCFADDTSSSKDNATTSHDAALSPEKLLVIMNKMLSNHLFHPLSNFAVFSDVGMMGSGSTNPCPENENIRFLKFATQLNGTLRQRALEGGADAGLRLEIIRLESKNTELSAAIRVLTEELAGARQELSKSKSCEFQLKLSLKEIGGVLPDSWEN